MYKIQCNCGSTELTITNNPKVRGICHCEDCRELLDVPFHTVNAWEKENTAEASWWEALDQLSK